MSSSLPKAFNDWLYGLEGYGLRAERLSEEMRDPVDRLLPWLLAAFEAGLAASPQQSPISGEGWQDWPRGFSDKRYEIGVRPDQEPSLCPFCDDPIDQTCDVTIIGGDFLSLVHTACIPEECAPPVPSVSGPEDQGSSLRDTQRGAERTVVGDGYQSAFYAVAEMLDLSAVPASPSSVWRKHMKPLLQKRLARWQSMDTAPTDRVIIAMARYRDATAGAPAFVAFMDGEWRELGRTVMEPMICWAWMPRDVLGDWPIEVATSPTRDEQSSASEGQPQ